MASILIIDDDAQLCRTLSRIIERIGHRVQTATTFALGFEIARTEDIDLVLLDVRLPDADGLEQLPAIQAVPSAPEVIILTGYAGPDGAELAIQGNAWDYLDKPASLDTVTLSVKRALQYRAEKQLAHSPVHLQRLGIVGESPAIKACLDLVARAAPSNANILISGETGTGKELFARAIHANSPRASRNFVIIDCTALPEELIESILFGHKKGAFTGADRNEEGLIRHAHGGTLFLDEVGELPLSMQKAFLRVLQEKHYRPVGSSEELHSDFRLVAATNRDLDKRVESGHFRHDLLFRLRSLSLHLPPLRERTEDIRDLAVHHLMMLCDSYNVGMKGFSPDFLSMMGEYRWPGNVRELFGALEYAMTQALEEQTLFPYHLPTHIRAQVVRSSFEGAVSPPSGGEIFVPPSTGNGATDRNHFPKWKEFRKALVNDGEKQYLQNLLALAEGDVKSASRLSNLSVPRIYELLRKHGLSTR